MVNNKRFKIIIIFIVLIAALNPFFNKVFADSEDQGTTVDLDGIMQDAHQFVGDGETVISADDMKPFSNTLYSILVIVGTIIAVGTGIVLRNTIYVLIC